MVCAEGCRSSRQRRFYCRASLLSAATSLLFHESCFFHSGDQSGFSFVRASTSPAASERTARRAGSDSVSVPRLVPNPPNTRLQHPLPVANFPRAHLMQEKDAVAQKLAEEGILTVSDPDFKALKQKAFADAPRSAKVVQEANGYRRRSLAAAMRGSSLMDFDGVPTDASGENENANCREFHVKMQEFRKLVRAIVFDVLRVLDAKDAEGSSDDGAFEQGGQITQRLLSATHLEHIHYVTKTKQTQSQSQTQSQTVGGSVPENDERGQRKRTPPGPDEEDRRTPPEPDKQHRDHDEEISLLQVDNENKDKQLHPLHVDAGLLLAMTNLHQVSNSKDSTSRETVFEVEHADGSISPVLVDNLDRLLLMGGLGFNRWRLSQGNVQVRGVPHRVSFRTTTSSEVGKDVVEERSEDSEERKRAGGRGRGGAADAEEEDFRIWYGMMLLPPNSHNIGRFGDETVTFGELAPMVQRGEFERAGSFACGPGLVLEEWWNQRDSKLKRHAEAERNKRKKLQMLEGEQEDVATGLEKRFLTGTRSFAVSGDNPIRQMAAAPNDYGKNPANTNEHQDDSDDEEAESVEQGKYRSACASHGGYWCWHRCMYHKKERHESHLREKARRIFGNSFLYQPGLEQCPAQDVQCVWKGSGALCKDGHNCELHCSTTSSAPGTATGNGSSKHPHQTKKSPPSDQEGRSRVSLSDSVSASPDANLSDPDINLFCGPGKTDMHMMGFKSILFNGGEKEECVMLFHEVFTLDSEWKFVLGVFSTLLFGVFTEWLVSVRRKMDTDLRTLRGKLVKVSLFAGNMCVGYLIMLITMIYSLELFLAVVLGLAIGHFLFNSKAPVGESVTACCAGRNNPAALRQTLFALEEAREEGIGRSGAQGSNLIETAEANDATLLLGGEQQEEDFTGKLQGGNGNASGERLVIHVLGMTCGNCEMTVRNALTALPQVEEVHSVSYASKRVDCTLKTVEDRGTVIEEIESLGFLVKQSAMASSSGMRPGA
eukprot:CAMPEP_0178983284 /NCGR_PEP_ID=MMETSP0795-20121207/973_1 /TAXON_ID=88552 /ORGANISM="Amoebophrya sp., Strain Ameob2" /LENGTH=997 /DNA_ID=CAMNT_0020674037 /DNA_START=231 /DNA_END=3224 /DNA_ORIENTATION=+